MSKKSVNETNNPFRIAKHWSEANHHQHKKCVAQGAVGVVALTGATVGVVALVKHHDGDNFAGCNGTEGEFNSAF